MCTPLAVVGAALLAGGTMASSAGQAAARSAQTNAVNNEVAQQRALQDQENANFQDSLSKSTPDAITNNANTDAASRLAAIRAQGGTDAATSVTPDDQSSPANKSALAQYNAANGAKLDTIAGGRATMGGLEDAFRTQAIATSPNAAKIAEAANFGQGDASILPIELAAASRKGGGLRSIGSLMSGFGSAALGAGALGAGAGAGAAAGMASPAAVDAVGNAAGGVGAGMSGSIVPGMGGLDAGAASIVPAAGAAVPGGAFSFLRPVSNAVRGGLKYMQTPF